MSQSKNRTADFRPLVAAVVRDVDPSELLDPGARRADVDAKPLTDGRQPQEQRAWPPEYRKS